MTTTQPPAPGVVLADQGTFHGDVDTYVVTRDPLGFEGYPSQVEAAAAASGASESVVAGPAEIGGHAVELAEFVFSFLGGSMGEAAGERLARTLERASARGVPAVIRLATGGARMQEGMRALIQMPKLVAARISLAEAQQPLIVVLGHPSTGGVNATLGGLGDVTIAERGATIGFAGPRVAGRYSGRAPDPTAYDADHAREHGLVDDVVDPANAAASVARVLDVLVEDAPEATPPPVAPVPREKALDAWTLVQGVRDPARVNATELLTQIALLRVELRGDRAGTDDPSCRVALTRIAGRRALIVATDRRHAPGPAAYRKARRCIDIAARLGIAVLTLVDMRTADPSKESQDGGLVPEIARLFECSLRAETPFIAVVTGEGGSGGALAFASADVLLACEGAIFSVISPDLASEIMWRTVDRAPEAARMLRVSAADLVELGIGDGLLPDPPDGTSITSAFAYHLDRLRAAPPREGWAAARRERWRRYGRNRQASP